ncbi:MAG: UDP-2,3-diacylglucosamine diphosphatase LpxI [Nitrospirota bacterium]|nr:UDP-2,3-diacylglucosamine diphosphatase LpxI [Nitrospirota bacterium]MDH5585790.1 UDP-2,3-diacylglucosamine diphosphatase LpxI [Nitrospirota bacterium]MDH5773827.1 UDP-2,3-diacylglucosamine diphosphatase LpxI [Nitrospirota bacterium]
MSPPNDSKRIGLIAGDGRFPIIFADNVRRLGFTVSAIAHLGSTLPELESHVEHIHWLKIGQFSKALAALKQDGVRQAVMLGGIKKTNVFTTLRPDLRALAIFSRLKQWKDDAILREVAGELEREGIEICESTFGLDGILADEGYLTSRKPSKKEEEDIQLGWEALMTLGQLDIGQCVVVKNQVIVAVEAVEGTDEAITRGGTLGGKGTVVVKRTKPHQDLRFDLPAIGPQTIRTMTAVQAKVLAIEAGRTVILDRDEVFSLAKEAGISIVGKSAQV